MNLTFNWTSIAFKIIENISLGNDVNSIFFHYILSAVLKNLYRWFPDGNTTFIKTYVKEKLRHFS